MGSDLHQDAIRLLADSLRLLQAKRGSPWHVSSQLVVLMGEVSGHHWHPSPDIFVHLTAGPDPLESFDAVALGTPELVIEVASPATWHYDVEGKRLGYEFVGVREYLVFDPTGDLLGEQVRAWRAIGRSFVPWGPETGGVWRSAVLDAVFQPQGLLLRTIDRDGALLPSTDEALRQIAVTTRQAEAAARRVAELEAELRKLRGESDDGSRGE